MKYGLLYGKDIETMTKEELCEHLINAQNQIKFLQDELGQVYSKYGHLFLAQSMKKSFLQRIFGF